MIQSATISDVLSSFGHKPHYWQECSLCRSSCFACLYRMCFDTQKQHKFTKIQFCLQRKGGKNKHRVWIFSSFGRYCAWVRASFYQIPPAELILSLILLLSWDQPGGRHLCGFSVRQQNCMAEDTGSNVTSRFWGRGLWGLSRNALENWKSRNSRIKGKKDEKQTFLSFK